MFPVLLIILKPWRGLSQLPEKQESDEQKQYTLSHPCKQLKQESSQKVYLILICPLFHVDFQARLPDEYRFGC